jgi:hypothetical protein
MIDMGFELGLDALLLGQAIDDEVAFFDKTIRATGTQESSGDRAYELKGDVNRHSYCL